MKIDYKGLSLEQNQAIINYAKCVKENVSLYHALNEETTRAEGGMTEAGLLIANKIKANSLNQKEAVKQAKELGLPVWDAGFIFEMIPTMTFEEHTLALHEALDDDIQVLLLPVAPGEFKVAALTQECQCDKLQSALSGLGYLEFDLDVIKSDFQMTFIKGLSTEQDVDDALSTLK